MSFSTSTGALTGTPTTVAGATTYTITATNATGSTTQTFTLTVSPGAATKAMMTTQPTGAVNGVAFTTQPVVRVTDSGNNTVTSFTGDVVVSIASGTGTLSGTTTVAAVAGVATFTNLVITGTAGNFSLTFTPASLTAVTSNSFALAAGAATKAMMTTQPTGAVNGVAFTTQPVVRVTDSGGNTVTTSTAVVTVSIASGSGTLSGTTATAVAGIATFTNLVITGTAGNFSLTFTPASLTAVTSSSFALAAGAATKVAITRASVGTTDNVAFTTQPQITIQDASGNTVSSSATVTATISGAGGTLIGTTTATASSGVATFTGLGIDGTNGTTYTITYTVSGLTVATATVTLAALSCAAGGPCSLGDTGPGGGKVFYIAASNFTSTGSTCNTTCRYLEAAPNTWSAGSSDPARSWSTGANQSAAVPGADGTAIGTGYRNSLAIQNQTGNVAATSAAVAARAYTGGSQTDWFLPSKEELAELYSQKATVGGFVAGYYWSSSVYGADVAWYQNFGSGYRIYNFKGDAYYVRPVRAF